MNNDFLGIEDFTVDKIAGIITGFACWLIGIVLVIMVIALVIAGIRYFLARGDATKVADATKNLTWTLVGILIILATNVIIATVANALGGNYSFIPLNCVGSSRGGVVYGNGFPSCPAGQVCSSTSSDKRGICVNN